MENILSFDCCNSTTSELLIRLFIPFFKPFSEHGAVLNNSCSDCVCHSGELICSKRQCNTSKGISDSNKFTGLPCNCSLHYLPVCGWNGVTFPNDCIAR